LRFLADESCDFSVVRALREAGLDVTAVAEVNPGIDDDVVLALAQSESRVLLTEDKGFGLLAYAGGLQTAGAVLIRFPGNAPGPAVLDAVSQFGSRLSKGFVVVEPGRSSVQGNRRMTVAATIRWRRSTWNRSRVLVAETLCPSRHRLRKSVP
jgi:hypothetical protein